VKVTGVYVLGYDGKGRVRVALQVAHPLILVGSEKINKSRLSSLSNCEANTWVIERRFSSTNQLDKVTKSFQCDLNFRSSFA
jgi:hypothetical protein